jgi:hypothetical protein
MKWSQYFRRWKTGCRCASAGKAASPWFKPNDLRQLATALLWLHRNGMEALVQRRRRVWDDGDSGARRP